MPAKLKRGDKVVVLAGKDRGKRGTVRQMVNKFDRVVVEGVNIVKKHQRARSQTQQSQIVEREAPIHISNVMLIDPNTDQPTRVTFREREDGTMVRVGKKSGEDIE
jgi:large subunit ribosomal protein L24